MHVALVIDEERLLHEHLMLNRLSIGLIDEGLQITRLVPEDWYSQQEHRGEQRVALARRLTYPARVPPWMKRKRARKLAEAMEKSPPDVIYAVGSASWPVAIDLGREMEKPVALDIWQRSQIQSVPTGRGATNVGAYVCPTAFIANLLRSRVDPDLIALVPVGVTVPREPRQMLAEAADSITLAVLGRGVDVAAYRAALGGLNRVLRSRPQGQVFVELSGARDHEIWQLIDRLEMHDQVSVITDAVHHRPLLLHCDVLILPEQSGEMRSLVMESMAAGLAIVAAEDPAIGLLVHDQTARLVAEQTANEWAEHLDQILSDVQFARRLGDGARRWVSEHQRSSQQVARLIATFERIVGGDAISFPKAGG